jgi:hypothetical protein
VGSHCYTVPGWAYRNCQRWIVLRNPWGDTDATTSILDATISMYDVSWWRPITLKDNDGVFAVEIGAFKKYFAGFGTAHEPRQPSGHARTAHAIASMRRTEARARTARYRVHSLPLRLQTGSVLTRRPVPVCGRIAASARFIAWRDWHVHCQSPHVCREVP